tara:strand:+ start:1004 stop:1306 length:303 start_codon:yes stop_codon:yes gene_type:complete
MWTIKERKAYNDAKEKEVRDKKEAKAVNRANADISIKKSIDKISTSLQTPKQREMLHAIFKVASKGYDARFISSCIKRKTLSKSQRNILNKIYTKYKNLI